MADRTITLSEREYETLLEVIDGYQETAAYLRRIPEFHLSVHALRRKARALGEVDEKCVHGWVGGCSNCETALGDYPT